VKIQGKGKGQFVQEGTPQFEKAAGSPTKAPDKRFAVLPKSEAEALGFRPTGSQPSSAIKPRTVGGRQVESAGAGRETHPITARTTRKAPTGPSDPNAPLEAPAPDPSAQHAFTRTIKADVAQAQGYNGLLDGGELGILRPGNISTGGVDAITATVEGGKAKIFLNDFTSPGTPKPSKATHVKWRAELDQAVKGNRLNFGDPATDQAIRDAIANGEIYVRPVRVELPAAATAGAKPGAGIAQPKLTIGTPKKL
jgi:hypothetical protein